MPETLPVMETHSPRQRATPSFMQGCIHTHGRWYLLLCVFVSVSGLRELNIKTWSPALKGVIAAPHEQAIQPTVSETGNKRRKHSVLQECRGGAHRPIQCARRKEPLE